MTIYVKKRIATFAMQYTGDESWDKLLRFSEYHVRGDLDDRDAFFVFDYLHNTWVRFKEGDWIIRGVKGEYYPCEEKVFAETYEVFHEEPAPF